MVCMFEERDKSVLLVDHDNGDEQLMTCDRFCDAIVHGNEFRSDVAQD